MSETQTTTLSLDARIESLLFFRAEALSIRQLAEALGTNEQNIQDTLSTLESKLSDRGMRLVYKGDRVMLGTAPEMSKTIEKLVKAELERDLGKAGLETLTIVLYRGPITRAEVDYIRGVNSRYILRHLLVRGLIERVDNPNDNRSYMYRATFELLGYLGIKKVEELPEYTDLRREIGSFEEQQKNNG